MHRFYGPLGPDGRALLSPEEARHALRVLRLSPGDPCELIAEGRRYRGVLLEGGRIEAIEELPSTEPSLRITLFQGLPKGEKMDWIVQKAAEIGVCRVVPVIMNRCIVKLTPPEGQKKAQRWQRIVLEACKQSGRTEIPTVEDPVPFSALSALSGSLQACAVPWEEEKSRGPAGFLRAHPDLRSLGLLIGPEGGIEPQEIAQLRDRFEPITLGPRILRTETAGLAACAAMLALRGEMEGTEG